MRLLGTGAPLLAALVLLVCFAAAEKSLPANRLVNAPIPRINLARHALVASPGISPAGQIFIGFAEGIAQRYIPTLPLCVSDVESTYGDFENFTQHLHLDISDVKSALLYMEDGLTRFNSALNDCELPEIANVTAKFVSRLHSIIGDLEVATEIVIDGVNVYDDLSQAATDFENGDFQNCGREIASAVTEIEGDLHRRFVAPIRRTPMKVALTLGPAAQLLLGVAEGIAQRYLPDVYNCAKDVVGVYDSFKDFSDHLHFTVSDVQDALSSLSDGLSDLESALNDCGVTDISETVAAFVAKLDSVIGDVEVAIHIVVDGIDIYEDLSSAATAFENDNYLECGKDVGDAIITIINA